MFNAISDYISRIIGTLLLLCIIFVPLGLWKLVEIIIWCITNISITIK